MSSTSHYEAVGTQVHFRMKHQDKGHMSTDLSVKIFEFVLTQTTEGMVKTLVPTKSTGLPMSTKTLKIALQKTAQCH